MRHNRSGVNTLNAHAPTQVSRSTWSMSRGGVVRCLQVAFITKGIYDWKTAHLKMGKSNQRCLQIMESWGLWATDDIIDLIMSQEMMLQLLYTVVCWAPVVTSAKGCILSQAAMVPTRSLWLWDVSLLHIIKKSNRGWTVMALPCCSA